jgi:RNA polymerase primary sigma factor
MLEELAGPASSRDAARGLAAGNELVVRNLRLVAWIATKHLGRGLPLEDLVQEGTLGLIRAADKFDPESGNRFSTYAAWGVKQAIGRALADKGRRGCSGRWTARRPWRDGRPPRARVGPSTGPCPGPFTR